MATPMVQPGAIFSTLFLLAMVYFTHSYDMAYFTQYYGTDTWPNLYYGICFGMWLFGILGRVLLGGSAADGKEGKEGLVKNEYVILA